MKLPFQARTSMGDTYDIEFPLHADTGDPVRVGQLVAAMLSVIDNEVAIAGETSNGDVLQAMAMALAIRTRMIHAPRETLEHLCLQLVETALEAMAEADRQQPPVGHA